MARPHDNVITWRVSLPDSGQQFEQSTFISLFLDNVTTVLVFAPLTVVIARMLGITRQTLRYRIEKYGLDK